MGGHGKVKEDTRSPDVVVDNLAQALDWSKLDIDRGVNTGYATRGLPQGLGGEEGIVPPVAVSVDKCLVAMIDAVVAQGEGMESLAIHLFIDFHVSR